MAETAFLDVTNNAVTTLTVALDDSATTVTVISTSLFPTVAPFDISIDSEIFNVTALTATTFTCTRGAQSTTATEHTISTNVELRVTAQTITDLNTAVNSLERRILSEIYIPFGTEKQTVLG